MMFTILFSFTTEAKNDDLNQGKELFLNARYEFYNGDKDTSEVIEIVRQSNSYFEKLMNKFDKYYWQAQIEFLLAEIYEVKGEEREAAQHFELSNKLALYAIKNNKSSSDAHRLLADTYMRLTQYKGTLYMMTSGPKALKLLQKAIKLDKDNYTAFNSLGTYYINAPEIGGGDVNKGIKMLGEALKSNDEFDNFISYIWLGNAYAKQKDKEKAIINLEKALKIYSASKWAQNTLKKIEEM